MAAAGSSYILATQVALNTEGAEHNLNSLTSMIKSSVSSMKAATAQANSYGDGLGAQRSKVEGLETVMGNLQTKIDTLKLKQEGLDTQTAKGADQFNNLQKQINNAKKQMANYSAQQDRAKQSLQYYESGLADVVKGYQNTIRESEAYANRLKAEGRDLDASKAKVKGYDDALGNMTKALKLQEEELDRNKAKVSESKLSYEAAKIELDKLKQSGKENTQAYRDQEAAVDRLRGALNLASEAYSNQKVRVDKTGQSIAETRSKQSELNESIKKVDGTPWEKLRMKMQETNKTGEKTHSMFTSIFSANLATNAVIAGWQSITMHIGEALKSGMEYDKEQQKMVATWTTLTGHHKDALVMVDDVNKLSVATGQSAQQTDELEQKFYHLHSSKEEAHDMTKAMLNMADAVGLNGEQIDAVSQDMTNALSRGKASAGEINQITQYFPMYREELAKSKNVTVQQLNEMVKQGKISADDMEKVFEHLGNVKYGKAADNMLSTMIGAQRVIKARVPALIGEIEEPIMNAKNPFTLAISKWLSDGSTDKAFGDLGKSVSKSISTIMNAFGKNITPGSLTKNLNGEIENLAKSVGKFGNFVAQHKKDIQQFFSTLKSAGAGGFKVLGLEAKVAGGILLPLLKFIDEHQKVMVPLIAGMLAFKNATSLLTPVLTPLIGTTKLLGNSWRFAFGGKVLADGTKSANVFKRIAGSFKSFMGSFDKAITGFADKVTKAYSVVGNTLSKMGRAIGSFREKVAKSMVKMAKSVGRMAKSMARMALSVAKSVGRMALSVAKSVGRMALSVAKSVGRMALSVAKSMARMALSVAKSAGRMAISVAKSVGQMALSVVKSVGQMTIAFATNPFGIAILAIGALVGAFALAYTKIKPFRDFINGLGRGIVNVFKGVIEFFKNNWKEIGLLIINPFAGISALLYKNVKPFRDFVNQVKDTIFKGFGEIGKFFSGFWNGTKSTFSSSLNFISKLWSNTWNGMVNVGRSIWNGITSAINSFWNFIKSIYSNGLSYISKLWTSEWNLVANIGRSIWNGISSFVGSFWNGIKNLFSSSLNFVAHIWSDSWNGVSNVGRSIMNAIFGFFGSFWDKTKGLWNSSLNWLKNLWKNVWDDIINIVHGAIEGVHHHVVDLARGVIKPINSMLSGLKEGINWVLDKVGAGKISAKWEIAMPSYATGTKDTHPGGLAKVNDAPGSTFREMFQLPNGQVGMFPNKRDLIFNLPAGTSVLDGKRSAKLAKVMGIPNYANGIGKFVGNLTKSVSGAFEGIWDKGADLLDMADKVLKNPAGFLETVFEKFLGGTSSSISLASDVITHFPTTVAKSAINWVKKLFEDASTSGDAGGFHGNPGGSGVQRWRGAVKRALEANGIEPTDGMVNKWLRQIATESGGNPRAVQGSIGDINNITGDLAKGLVQVIGSTFRANAFPGHTDIFNGYDNLLAGINYAKKKYGPGMSFIGNGHGYADGGFVTQHQMAEIAEGNMPEYIIPTDPAKKPRSDELLRQANATLGHKEVNSGIDEKLVDKIDKLTNLVSQQAGLVSQLLNGQMVQTQTIRSTAQKPRDRYIQDAQNGALRNYQMGGA